MTINIRFWHTTCCWVGVCLLGMLFACSGSEELEDIGKPEPITYKIKTAWNSAESDTRGQAFDDTEGFTTLGRTFCISAWMQKTDEDMIPLTSNSNPNALENADVSYQGPTTGWSSDDPYFWPDMEYLAYFYAWYPKGTPFKADSKTIVYDSSTPVEGNDDVMYATYRGGYLHNEGGGVAVELDFHHALSCVQFKVVKSGELTVSVNSLEICNVKCQGTFHYPTALTGDNYGDFGTGNWIGITGNKDYQLGNSSLEVTTTPQLLTSEANGSSLMFPPQTTTAWDNTTATIEQNNNGTKGTYLKIGCSVVFGGNTYNDNGYVYCPISLGLAAGTKTVYTIGFGVGYDRDGKKLLQSIILSTQVEDWTSDGTESASDVYIN